MAFDDRARIAKAKVDIVIHAGNTTFETALVACRLARANRCPLLFSGGIGHSTELLLAAA